MQNRLCQYKIVVRDPNEGGKFSVRVGLALVAIEGGGSFFCFPDPYSFYHLDTRARLRTAPRSSASPGGRWPAGRPSCAGVKNPTWQRHRLVIGLVRNGWVPF